MGVSLPSIRITLVLWNAPLGGGCHSCRDDDEDETLMNLMNMVRLFGFVLIGWTFLAWRRSLPEQSSAGRGDSLLLARPPASRGGWGSRSQLACVEEYRLVDRSTGRRALVAAPDATWGFVTVSPWRDQDGNLEAVGDGAGPARSATNRSTAWGYSGCPMRRSSAASIWMSFPRETLLGSGKARRSCFPHR